MSSTDQWQTAYDKIKTDVDSLEAWEDLVEIAETQEKCERPSKAWTKLALDRWRQTYEEMLARFPLLAGYWLKYASTEYELGYLDRAQNTYERAISMNPSHVRLWTRYCCLQRNACHDRDKVWALFGRAASHIGYHYLSHEFWDAFLSYAEDLDTENSFSNRVLATASATVPAYKQFALLARIVQIPIHQYARYYNKLAKKIRRIGVDVVPKGFTADGRSSDAEAFDDISQDKDRELENGALLSTSTAFINSNNVLAEQELIRVVPLRETVSREKRLQFEAEFEVSVDRAEDDGYPNAYSQYSDEQKSDYDFYCRMAYYYLEIFMHNQTEVQARWKYESAIRRHYFHPAYLSAGEFVNWRRYLAFEEASGNDQATIQLYERAVAVTGLYEEFWLRYSRWLLGHNRVPDAYNLLKRASLIVPIGRTQVRHELAKLEEWQGAPRISKMIYASIIDVLADSLLTHQLLLALVLRNEGFEPACLLAENTLVESKLSLPSKAVYLGQYAQILASKRSVQETRDLYKSYAEAFAFTYYFWRQYLDFEASQAPSPQRDDEVRAVIEKLSSTSKLAPHLREDLIRIYMAYLLRDHSCLPEMTSAAREFSTLDPKHVSSKLVNSIQVP